MNTLSSTTRNRIPYWNDKLNTLAFPVAADAVLPVGAPVKLNSSGEAVAIAAATDIIAGIVIVPSSESNSYEVTILTKFRAVIIAQAAGGTLATGAQVAASGLDATTKLGTYVAYVAGTNQLAGQVLKGAASGAEITVGIY